MRPALFMEVHGLLEPRPEVALDGDVVMLTNIGHGAGQSRPLNGLTLRYVGRGEERYRIAGRTFRLPEGHLMIARQEPGADIEIRKSGPSGTLGLCTFLASNDTRDLGELEEPVIIGGSCSPVGDLMKGRLKSLLAPAPAKSTQANSLIRDLELHLPVLMNEIADQADAIGASKRATRYHAVRKVNEARSYLHAVMDRPVGLDELATVVGMSRFHLQRTFKQAVGETPALYHRRLRLGLAVTEAERRGIALNSIADEFGFAGVSSLSHAYRRAFGHPPRWSKLKAV